MRIYLGSLLAASDGPQFLITVHDNDTVTSSSRPTSDSAASWTEPVLIGVTR